MPCSALPMIKSRPELSAVTCLYRVSWLSESTLFIIYPPSSAESSSVIISVLPDVITPLNPPTTEVAIELSPESAIIRSFPANRYPSGSLSIRPKYTTVPLGT